MAEKNWFEGLRRQIKHRCGPGWGIDERHGGVRLTRRSAAGKQHIVRVKRCSWGSPGTLQQKQHGATPTVSSRWMTKRSAGSHVANPSFSPQIGMAIGGE